VRRVLLVLVLAVVGAGWYGLAGGAPAISVNGTSVSARAFDAELSTFASQTGLYCYMSSLANAAVSKPGAGNHAVTTASEVAWANLRVEGLAIANYVTRTYHYVPDAAQLSAATTALEGELAQAATQTGNSCPGTPAQALSAMPTEMRDAQILDQAMSMYLVSQLHATIPLTATSLKAYYLAHVARYDTLCVSVAIVAPNNVGLFHQAQLAGASMSQLAKKYSLDSSASRGGSYGCFAPSSSSYVSVRNDVGASALGHFPTTPIAYTPTAGGTTYALYVGASARTHNPFATAEGVVLSDVQTLNATAANAVKSSILYHAAVAIDPELGRWALTTTGPSIFAPAVPGESGPATTSQVTTVSTTPYQ